MQVPVQALGSVSPSRPSGLHGPASVRLSLPKLPSHGFEAHSSMLTSHRSPSKPAKHAQMYDSNDTCVSVHAEPCMHGNSRHASGSSSQFSPVHPESHEQTYSSIPTAPCALSSQRPFAHGTDLHSSKSTSHSKPTHPSGQLHAKAATISSVMHSPPFMHGSDAHSSMSSSHWSPW